MKRTINNSRKKKFSFWMVSFSLTLLIALSLMFGCESRAHCEMKNYPQIGKYIDEWMALFQRVGLNELHMEAVPSVDGGQIVLSGFVPDKDTYDILATIISSKVLNSPPTGMVWKVQVRPTDNTANKLGVQAK